MIIQIDSREQDPLMFRPSDCLERVETVTLKSGDYGIQGYPLIAIERKSLADLYQTLMSGNERFQRELERTIGYDLFGIVVEGSFSDFRDKKWIGSHYTKPGENHAIKTLYTLQFKYPWVHIWFVKDRNEASSFIRLLFKQYVAWKDKPEKLVVTGDVPCWLPKMINKIKRRGVR